ncbi:hypothetical protein A3F37_02715 [Candidatus Saccharibacteria bacterium RIFCSPHIGHO2_12_FULL_41_12]|nr:MAG: hypothetical protein A3F37_02715 [Candidatus Saccharibacteria bacterium RIFCSPHIGHO2_12_FULL_41_12]
MDISVNYLAVFLAAIVSVVVGAVWYSNTVLGQTWRKLVRLTGEDIEDNTLSANIKAFAMSLLSAFILFNITFLYHQYFNSSWMSASLGTAFWVWLGFIVTSHVTHDTFRKRDFRLTTISLGHHLMEFLAMGLVIGLIGR